ncbi:MAG: FHA domain-containing protein [Proteobacteria bacterium]|nr:FHA domain-containing protein [Pseudomonadota bacterium]
MALNTIGNSGNDALTAAVLSILEQGNNSDATIMSVSRRIAPSTKRMEGLRQRSSESDSAPADVYYSESAGDNEIHCRSCGAVCPRTNKYCGFCAAYLGNYSSKQQFSEIDIQPINLDICLIAINEDSTDGVRIPLKFNETVLGRSVDSRFPSDAFLSPRHCRLLVENRTLYIEDLNSLNGTFIRVRGEVPLQPGDSFLAGRQLLRFERFEQVVSNKARSVDGTRYMGSPASGGDFKLVQIGIGNITLNVYCLSENGAVFGRETGDIVFNRDRFMSGRHGQIYPHDDGTYYLLDLNSSNGTWLKINGKTKLTNGDLIFLGQQLFRVESPDIV